MVSAIRSNSATTAHKKKKSSRKDWTSENKKMVGIARFELATFCPPDKRANQAALYPEPNERNILAVPKNANSKTELFMLFMLLIPYFRFSI